MDAALNRLAADARSPAACRARISALEQVLERAFTFPGTRFKFGLDPIFGLVPVLGDLVAGAMSAYIIWEARNLGMSKWQLGRMAGNTLLDTAIGSVPILGQTIDFFFRSNTRNLKIIKKHLDRHHPATVTVEGDVIRRAR